MRHRIRPDAAALVALGHVECAPVPANAGFGIAPAEGLVSVTDCCSSSRTNGSSTAQSCGRFRSRHFESSNFCVENQNSPLLAKSPWPMPSPRSRAGSDPWPERISSRSQKEVAHEEPERQSVRERDIVPEEHVRVGGIRVPGSKPTVRGRREAGHDGRRSSSLPHEGFRMNCLRRTRDHVLNLQPQRAEGSRRPRVSDLALYSLRLVRDRFRIECAFQLEGSATLGKCPHLATGQTWAPVYLITTYFCSCTSPIPIILEEVRNFL